MNNASLKYSLGAVALAFTCFLASSSFAAGKEAPGTTTEPVESGNTATLLASVKEPQNRQPSLHGSLPRLIKQAVEPVPPEKPAGWWLSHGGKRAPDPDAPSPDSESILTDNPTGLEDEPVAPKVPSAELPLKPIKKPKKWDHALPFLAQKVVDMGYKLPKPYGVSLIYDNMFQQLTISNLEIALNDGDKVSVENLVHFPYTSDYNEAFNIKLDAWLFPFMNIYAVLGYSQGYANIDVNINLQNYGNQLCDVDYYNNIEEQVCTTTRDGRDCDDGMPSRDYRKRTFIINNICPHLPTDGLDITIEDLNTYTTSLGIGTVLATGWDNWFFALPITYIWSDTNVINQTTKTLNIGPRIGYDFKVKHYGRINPYWGANYMKLYSLTFTGEVPAGANNTITWYIDQRNTSDWNHFVGFNWEFSKHWGWTAEYAYGAARRSFLTAVDWRW